MPPDERPSAPKTVSLPLLDRIEIAAPCPARWDDMTGDSRTRFCSECSLHAHNISDMTATEAEAFLRECLPAGRVCVRLYRRHDGTILTKDCPVGLAKLAARVRQTVTRAFCALLGLIGAAATASQTRTDAFASNEPFRSLVTWMRGKPPTPLPSFVMGKVALPSAPVPISTVPPPPGNLMPCPSSECERPQ